MKQKDPPSPLQTNQNRKNKPQTSNKAQVYNFWMRSQWETLTVFNPERKKKKKSENLHGKHTWAVFNKEHL